MLEIPPKILFLGASPQQLAPIDYARASGYGVVTCDNVPSNQGHVLADASYDVSTTDYEGILRVAKKEKIDAIVCYATDVAARTAAYVSEQLELPGNPLKSVEILTNKAAFRRYQTEKGMAVPAFSSFTATDLLTPDKVIVSLEKSLALPVMVKPVDASGCKGISMVDSYEKLIPAINNALDYSNTGSVIVEEVIERQGYQVCGEAFLQGGNIIFHAFANEHFTPEITVPVGETFPSIFAEEQVAMAVSVLQEIMTDLHMRVGAFNFDLFFTPTNEVFVIEIGPRNGGNRMPDAIKLAYGADMIGATVEAALGREIELAGEVTGYYATYSIHARNDGILRYIQFSDYIESRIVDKQLFAAVDSPVHRFDKGSNMLGNLILRFDDYTEMLSAVNNMEQYIVVGVDSGKAAG